MGNYTEKKKNEPTIGKTENFWTRNVKLITFIICMVVLLAVIGPLSIFTIKEYIDEKDKNGDPSKPEMTFENVIGISKMGKTVTWETLKQFRSENRSTKENLKYVYRISDNCELWATGDIDSKKPTEILLVCFLDGGSKCDIMKEDVSAYIKQIKEKTE